MRTDAGVTQLGWDIDRKFSKVTARDSRGKIAWRQRLDHCDRPRMRERLADWPNGAPVVLEGTFGWGWMSDELTAAGLDPHLASSSKLAAWRKARGMAKSNRKHADLLSELWSEQGRWWEVWLAPPRAGRRRGGHRRSHRAAVAKASSAKRTSRPELGQPEDAMVVAAVVGRLQASL